MYLVSFKVYGIQRNANIIIEQTRLPITQSDQELIAGSSHGINPQLLVTSGTGSTAHVHVHQCGSNQPVRSVLQRLCSEMCGVQTSVNIIIE